MKKLILGFMLGLAGIISSQAAGLVYTTNFTGDSTNFMYLGTAPIRVGQIVVFGSQAGVSRFYDTLSNNLKQVVGSVTLATNYSWGVTNLQTNGIYIFSGSTQYMIQTNSYVGGNFRTNITYPGLTNDYPIQASMAWIAGGVSSITPLDMIFERGLTVATTTNVTVIVYTK